MDSDGLKPEGRLTGPSHCRLHHGPFQETLAICRGSADLVAFSPPYCDARTYGMDCSWGDAEYAALGDAVFAALRPGGWALVNVDAPVRSWRRLCSVCDRMSSDAVCPACGAKTVAGPTERGFHPWRLMLDWAERVGFRVPDRLAFGRQGLPGEYRGRFRNDWEPLLWFQRPGADGYFDRWPLAEPAKYGRNVSSQTLRGRRADGGMEFRPYSGRAAEEGATHRGTVWSYGSIGSGQSGAPDIEAQNHPARWPFRLASDIIQCFCPPGGLVVDPFIGAGTTAVAALVHGRDFVGGDLGARQSDGKLWVDVAVDVLIGRGMRLRPEHPSSEPDRFLEAPE